MTAGVTSDRRSPSRSGRANCPDASLDARASPPLSVRRRQSHAAPHTVKDREHQGVAAAVCIYSSVTSTTPRTCTFFDRHSRRGPIRADASRGMTSVLRNRSRSERSRGVTLRPPEMKLRRGVQPPTVGGGPRARRQDLRPCGGAAAAETRARVEELRAVRRRSNRWPTGRGARYQACEPPQCGQPTEVETAAWKTKPHSHEYIAWSSAAGSRRRLAPCARAGTVEPLSGRSSASDVVGRAARTRSAAERSGGCPSAPTGSRGGRRFRWRPSLVAPDLLLASTRYL